MTAPFSPRRALSDDRIGEPTTAGDPRLPAGEAVLRERLEAGLSLVEERLAVEVAYGDELAADTSRYLLNAGGKRVRPMLTLLAAQYGQTPDADAVITAAAAVELTHLASLYHDDVMDEADLRRGVRAAHLNWSNSVAILAGDLLFARSSLLFSSLGQRCIELQARTFERLVLGQLRETTGPKSEADRVDHYVGVLADKTGSLIASAVVFGGITAKAPERVIEALSRYGEYVGVAFQLADDVIDLSPDAAATGKLAGTDLRAGVETLPVLLLERRARVDDAAAALLDRIRTHVAGTSPTDDDPRIAAIVAELAADPATAQTREEAARWAELAIESLAPIPAGAAKHALVQFARDVVARDR